MRRSLIRLLAIVALALGTALTGMSPAQAAVSLEQKLAALSDFTQPTAASADAWRAAWQNQAAWAEYEFDWSTDLCSSSPDQPLGFDFRMPCRRHDFGYRNYKALDRFPANKDRVDDAFYFDMRRVCSGYSGVAKATCDGLAWTYYQAVKQFGNLNVTQEQIEQVRRQIERDYRAAAA
ncbi:phospholipase [Thermostaphylospora chromogena]|uniref:Phospholipase A2 n=1 Tax=Thermostaphylospora chromogena TaxID=35622 RepID=A0A1H1I2X2_9ACTN|nr:phospholipase [Thermostaphylospora chromogena]SDR32075.1 phospholipase A2 [Thermostaphylospora chromogena]